MTLFWKAAFAAMFFSLLGNFGNAQAGTKFPLELNRLEQDGDVCRVYLLIKNSEVATIEVFKLDLVFFDKENIIQNRLYVELGPLPGSKTGVRLFDIPETQCQSMGSILVNDVVECEGTSAGPLNCLQRLELSSRAGVELKY
jgi:hypothetical protein